MKMKMNITNNTTVDHSILAEAIMNNTTEFDGVRFASINLSLLKVCEDYQRPIDNEHIKELTPFIRNQAGVLTVSYRDGWFWIIDGQHRFVSAYVNKVDKEGNEIKRLNCVVLTGLTAKDEAKIFKKLNVTQKKPDPYKIFHANVFSGDMSDPEVVRDVTIYNICKINGIEVKKFSRRSSGKTLRCLTKVQDIIECTTYNGTECFKWIIEFINSSNWADVSTAYTREIIVMLKDFWVDNKGNSAAEKRLYDVINGKTAKESISPTEVINGAKHFYCPRYSVAAAMSLYLKDLMEGRK